MSIKMPLLLLLLLLIVASACEPSNNWFWRSTQFLSCDMSLSQNLMPGMLAYPA
jgi:hypothetical protein